MKTKRTPGPWSLKQPIFSTSDGVRCRIVTAKTYPAMAKVQCEDATGEANARLISAAPELLAVAKLIVAEWQAPTEGTQVGTLIARLSQYATEARAAIAKAEVELK